MNRTIVTISLVAAFAVAAMTMPTYVGVFNTKYKVDKNSPVAKAKCGVCHVGMTKKLNPYGDEIVKVQGGVKKLTAEMLEKIEDKDSDGDGVKNGAELKAGTLPGDKASK